MIRSFNSFLKTDVKVLSEMIETQQEKGKNPDVITEPGCRVQVKISNTSPIESDYPMIVFIGVGLGVQFPKSMPRSIKRMANEFNFEVDLTNATQNFPSHQYKINSADDLEFETITIDEQSLGHVLFPGTSIKYKFRLTYKECPDIKEVKLYAEGTISARHLLHYLKEITVSNENIVDHL